MAYERKNFNELRNLNFTSKGNKFDYAGKNKFTSQGFAYIDYDLNLSAQSSLIKNYTSNALTNNLNAKDILKFNKLNFRKDLNTTFNFKPLDTLSAFSVATALTNKKDDDSILKLSTKNTTTSNGQAFLVDFLDDRYCTVSMIDGVTKKFLYREEDNVGLVFRFLNSNTIDTKALTSNYYFEYNYDTDNNYLKLKNNNKLVTTGTRPLTSTSTGLSSNDGGVTQFVATIVSVSNINTAVLSTADVINSRNGLIKVDPQLDITGQEFLDQFVYYDFVNDYKLSDESLSAINYNLLTYFPYNNISLSSFDLSGSDNNFYVDLDFFNLKNQLSNSNIVHSESVLDDPTHQRKYYNITNSDSTEKSEENLSLNYTFFNKEYEIFPNKMNRITMPESIFPFKKININDTTLANNGAFAAKSPYFSDKVFKNTDKNENTLAEQFEETEEFLVDQDDQSFILLQDDNILGFQNLNEIQSNDLFGTYLCTWLKDEGSEAVWYDRYYLPDTKSFQVSLTGTATESSFDNLSQAKQFFEKNKVGTYYFDVRSNLTFEPNASYLYQRIGKDYINLMISNQESKLVKSNFEVLSSGGQVITTDSFNLNTLKGYDRFKIDEFKEKSFQISFDLELDSLSSFDAYQLMGNLYNDGVSVKSNFYFTPFVFLPFKNTLNIYDYQFNLINSVTIKGITDILDVLYMEQNNDIVVICSNKILKMNVFGTIVAERDLDGGFNDPLLIEICKSYKSKSYYGTNNAVIFTNDYNASESLGYNIDLNTLLITDLRLPINTLSASNSLVYSSTSGNFVPIQGFRPLNVNKDFIISLDQDERFISQQFIPGEAFRVSQTLSGTFLSGINAGRSFNGSLYRQIIQEKDSSYDNFFDFVPAGNNRLIFDNLVDFDELTPIVDSVNSNITDINSIEEKIYIQNFENESGNVQVINTDRFFLSSFPLQARAVSGIGIDFIREGNKWKLLSFSKDLTGNTLVDKFDTVTGAVENTYTLNISVNDPTSKNIYYTSNKLFVVSAALGFPALSSTFAPNITAGTPTGSLSTNSMNIQKYQRVSREDYAKLIDPTIGATEGAVGAGVKTYVLDNLPVLSSNRLHNTFTNANILNSKYKDFQDNITFKIAFDTSINASVSAVNWDKAGPPVSAYGFDSFNWNQPQQGLSAWDGQITSQSSASAANFEFLFKLPKINIQNRINMDFNLNTGLIKLYNNSVNFGTITFNPNYVTVNKFLTPDIFVNTQNINNLPLEAVSKTFSGDLFRSKGGTIKNFKLYNTSINQDLVNYLNLTDQDIDLLYFDMYDGTKNDIEEIDSLYNYKIPGSKNNAGKVHIKNIEVDDSNVESLIQYVHSNLVQQSPLNMQQFAYVVNNKEYHVMDNGDVMTGDTHSSDASYIGSTNSSSLNINNNTTDNDNDTTGGGY